MDSKKSAAKSDDVKKIATELAKDSEALEAKSADGKKTDSAAKKKASSAKKVISKAVDSAKKTAEKVEETVKKTAAKAAVKASDLEIKVVLQDDLGNEKSIDDIKAEVLANIKKKSVKTIDVYVKPSENTVYFVADGENDSITLFG